ncbi:hypothetical protein NEF87_002255 [Candidatus Lokiarchaeum ossiferum]|uniref:Transcriptional regulator n=1 Tax=Candidatus Lokiarchaeum ossiferum TaxID=2951803 RepID=A0ABY6HR31_9ARCH|nr:hypothetical protein NEF87_002255 [Candidatus Lokiarchaeum sp. B-35]
MPKTKNTKDDTSGKSFRKVHITYNSKEFDRITDPIFKEQPDVIYYIHHNGKKEDIFQEHLETNIQTITKRLPNTPIVQKGADYIDYYDIISLLAQIISTENLSHPEISTEFMINMGTGSKMVAIANMDAVRLWDNISFTYPYSLDYNPEEKSTHKGAMLSAVPPKMEFRKPSLLLIQTMQLILWLMENDRYERKRKFVMQKDLQNLIFNKHKIMKVTPNSNPRKQDSSEKIRLNSKVIAKLRDHWKFITRKKQGKSYRIYFTENGRKMARVFMNYDYGLELD